jgi:hypothetical protein
MSLYRDEDVPRALRPPWIGSLDHVQNLSRARPGSLPQARPWMGSRACPGLDPGTGSGDRLRAGSAEQTVS